jgi:heme oxygenase
MLASAARHFAAGPAHGGRPMMAVLKRGTRRLHTEAERWVPLVGAGATQGAYRAYLAAMHAYCAQLEPALARVRGLDAVLPDWRRRRKVMLLVRDLEQLAARAHRGATDDCAMPTTPSPSLAPRTVADALGALYVVEGATLGGRIIARHLASSLGITAERAGSFLHAYGDDVGPMWKTFGVALDRFAVARDDRAAVLAAARRTFGAVTRLLAQGHEA